MWHDFHPALLKQRRAAQHPYAARDEQRIAQGDAAHVRNFEREVIHRDRSGFERLQQGIITLSRAYRCKKVYASILFAIAASAGLTALIFPTTSTKLRENRICGL